ncbi:MAG: hypothetical protein CL760_00280 [Chloroflexi bacterium]|nr:hypothetical protein [Chloroflexota bacterium]|tara:strand:+ start:50965 stop:51405 length:441 start_codon:yes stop_codon:yes gene_type:complete
MFSLIISIIAIALVASLALASIYYGGDAFQEGTVKAEASTIVNQGQQVQAAVTMAEIDDVTLASVADLAPTYLKEIPKFETATWAFDDDSDPKALLLDLDNEATLSDLCKQTEALFDGNEADAGSKNEHAFGCYNDGSSNIAYFKL